jgi:hypothetical protein
MARKRVKVARGQADTVRMLWKLVGVASMASFFWLWRHVGLGLAIVPPTLTLLAAFVAQRASR